MRTLVPFRRPFIPPYRLAQLRETLHERTILLREATRKSRAALVLHRLEYFRPDAFADLVAMAELLLDDVSGDERQSS